MPRHFRSTRYFKGGRSLRRIFVQKVFLKKGETQKIVFNLSEKELGFWHNDLTFYAEPGTFKVFVGGDSNAALSGVFVLE